MRYIQVLLCPLIFSIANGKRHVLPQYDDDYVMENYEHRPEPFEKDIRSDENDHKYIFDNQGILKRCIKGKNKGHSNLTKLGYLEKDEFHPGPKREKNYVDLASSGRSFGYPYYNLYNIDLAYHPSYPTEPLYDYIQPLKDRVKLEERLILENAYINSLKSRTVNKKAKKSGYSSSTKIKFSIG